MQPLRSRHLCPLSETAGFGSVEPAALAARPRPRWHGGRLGLFRTPRGLCAHSKGFFILSVVRRLLTVRSLRRLRRHAGLAVAASPDSERSVVFLHDTEPNSWKGAVAALNSVATRCSGKSLGVGALIALVADVRSQMGCSVKLNAFAEALERAEKVNICERSCLENVVAFAAKLAARLPEAFPDGLAMLRMRRSAQVVLSREQCASLIAASLFGVLPGFAVQSRGQWDSLPEFEFSFLLKERVEKMLCVVNYLHAVSMMSAEALAEKVSFSRRVTDEKSVDESFWSSLDKPLTKVVVSQGAIEQSFGNLQADFANRRLGGGALHAGQVQEEIRFAICPECFVGMLFCETMLANEALFIVGSRQYSAYSGYGDSFRFTKPFRDDTEMVDAMGRRGPHIVAFDALQYPGDWQYEGEAINRELIKAYTACLGDLSEDQGQRQQGFATGNWGCGAFGGDPQLKALIQWLAASAAGRELHYFPFGDGRMFQLPEVVEVMQQKELRCSDLYDLLHGHERDAVFGRVLERVRAY